jgi:hypothetical protein
VLWSRPREKKLDRWLAKLVPMSTTAEEVMKFVNAAFVSALAGITIGATASESEAAPLPTNIAAMMDTAMPHARRAYLNETRQISAAGIPS